MKVCHIEYVPWFCFTWDTCTLTFILFWYCHLQLTITFISWGRNLNSSQTLVSKFTMMFYHDPRMKIQIWNKLYGNFQVQRTEARNQHLEQKWKTGVFSQYPRPGLFPTLKPNSDKPRLKQIKVMGMWYWVDTSSSSSSSSFFMCILMIVSVLRLYKVCHHC
jgi:hypothetical protein